MEVVFIYIEMGKTWILLVASVVMGGLGYLIQSTRWKNCSFSVGLWEMGFGVMIMMYGVMMFGGIMVIRVTAERRRKRLWILVGVIAALQIGSLCYLVWGTKATILLLEKEDLCVPPT